MQCNDSNTNTLNSLYTCPWNGLRVYNYSAVSSDCLYLHWVAVHRLSTEPAGRNLHVWRIVSYLPSWLQASNVCIVYKSLCNILAPPFRLKPHILWHFKWCVLHCGGRIEKLFNAGVQCECSIGASEAVFRRGSATYVNVEIWVNTVCGICEVTDIPMSSRFQAAVGARIKTKFVVAESAVFDCQYSPQRQNLLHVYRMEESRR